MPKPDSPSAEELPKLSRQTRKAIEGLRDFFEIGRTALKNTEFKAGRSTYRSAAMQKFAAGEGLGKSNAYEARHFAEQYSQRELEELIDICRAKNIPFGFSHIVELRRVDDPKVWRYLQKRAIEERWSVRRLHQEVKMVREKA